MSLFFARFWPYIAGVALIAAAFFGFQVLQSKLDVAQAQRDKAMVQLQTSNESIKALQSDVDRQNAAAAQVAADGERRLLEGRALILEEVRKGTRTIEAASRLSAQPKTGGDQSKTSEAVLALRGDL